MKKETLGATLRRRLDESRQSEFENAMAKAGEFAPADVLTGRKWKSLVAKMFKSARKQIAKGVKLGTTMEEVSVVLGAEGLELDHPVHREAIQLLQDACWPMTIPAGIQISDCLYYFEWVKLKTWAAEEDLAVELRMEVDQAVLRTQYLIVVKPR